MSYSLKLDKKDVEDMLELSPLQEGLLYHYITEPESDSYFEQLSLSLSGEVDLELLEDAFAFVVQGNEMLRAVFRWEKLERPLQIILKRCPISFTTMDLTGLEPNEQRKTLEEVKLKDRKQKIDIRVKPLRMLACKMAEQHYELIISYHHVLYDGWSQSIILKEWFNAYDLLLCKKPLTPKPKTKFKEFSKWSKLQKKEDQKKFWSEYLAGFETKTQLPIERGKQKNRKSFRKANNKLSKELTTELSLFLKAHQLTIATFIYTAWGIVLQRYNSSDDCLFGTTVSGRPAEIQGIEDIVGLFINTIPMRMKADSTMTALNLFNKMDHSLRARSEYESTSLVDIASYSEIGHTGELFDSIVVIENYPLDKQITNSGGSIHITGYEMFERTHYDFTLVITSHDTLEIELNYCEEVCKPEIAENMLHHLVHIMENILAAPESKLNELEMLGKEERSQIVEQFNASKFNYPQELSVHEWFEQQAIRTPDRIALVFADCQMTYKELNEKSNQLAWLLRERGVVENKAIGVMIERSCEMMIGILAIIKAGGAYVPIDPDYPEERIRYLLEHSQTTIMLTLKKHLNGERFYPKTTELIAVDDLIQETRLPVGNLNLPYDPQRLLYILYTSGSTGNPKGVMVKSHAFVNLLHWFITEFQINEADNILFIAPISFDLAQKNLFSTLLTGGKLVIQEPGIYDYNRMSDTIANHQITLINCAPSAFYPLVEFNVDSGFARIRSLRNVFLGGESINFNKLNLWCQSAHYSSEITNTYGPTECTDIASFYRIDINNDQDKFCALIGKPIHNTQLYVMDHRLNVLPVGIPGELCIGGVGLAAGYYNTPHLSTERFMDCSHIPSKKVYRTGDMARWRSDGNLEYLGRMDNQIKINGMRLELGEIEAAIQKMKGINEAVVVAWNRIAGREQTVLCAYFVSAERISLEALRLFLSEALPVYMLPTHFIQMDILPLTPNGKVNRRALPEPVLDNSDKNYKAPENEIEEKLMEIWRKVLGKEKLGTQDLFFEAGGNSILLIQLHAQIDKIYPSKVAVTDLFAYPTVAKLASFIAGLHEDEESHAERPQLLCFPEDYYNDIHHREKNNAVLQTMVSEDLISKLSIICKEQKITLYDLMFGMFLYLLIELTGQRKITLYSLVKEHKNLIPITVDTHEMNDFFTLFQSVMMQRTQEKHVLIYPIQRLYETSVLFENSEILPCFYNQDQSMPEMSLLQHFGLLVGVKLGHSTLSIACEYSRSLRTDKIKELLQGYTQLLETLAFQYQNNEGVV